MAENHQRNGVRDPDRRRNRTYIDSEEVDIDERLISRAKDGWITA